MTAYIYAATVITTDKALGNQFAAAIDPDSGGAETFNKGWNLRTGGSGPATAWASEPLLTATGYGRITEFLSAGPWPGLNALGFTDGQIGYAKSKMTINAGTRESVEGTLKAFVTANGYNVINPMG